jgi:hypothetical protein
MKRYPSVYACIYLALICLATSRLSASGAVILNDANQFVVTNDWAEHPLTILILVGALLGALGFATWLLQRCWRRWQQHQGEQQCFEEAEACTSELPEIADVPVRKLPRPSLRRSLENRAGAG